MCLPSCTTSNHTRSYFYHSVTIKKKKYLAWSVQSNVKTDINEGLKKMQIKYYI